jgi:hypothetical protein
MILQFEVERPRKAPVKVEKTEDSSNGEGEQPASDEQQSDES